MSFPNLTDLYLTDLYYTVCIVQAVKQALEYLLQRQANAPALAIVRRVMISLLFYPGLGTVQVLNRILGACWGQGKPPDVALRCPCPCTPGQDQTLITCIWCCAGSWAFAWAQASLQYRLMHPQLPLPLYARS